MDQNSCGEYRLYLTILAFVFICFMLTIDVINSNLIFMIWLSEHAKTANCFSHVRKLSGKVGVSSFWRKFICYLCKVCVRFISLLFVCVQKSTIHLILIIGCFSLVLVTYTFSFFIRFRSAALAYLYKSCIFNLMSFKKIFYIFLTSIYWQDNIQIEAGGWEIALQRPWS